jgi:holo-[acyl-carrier protein] synthase
MQLTIKAAPARAATLGRCRDGVPMILGIGTDLANIDRIQRALDRFRRPVPQSRLHGDRAEPRRADENPAATYAKRWAAKEACSKALGTGLRMGIAWKDMAVTNLSSGQPVMEVTGWARERLDQMTPDGYIATIHVSLTDDHPWAQAFVVIEAAPEDEEEHRPHVGPVSRRTLT